jgi:hypothetical protein
MRQLHPLHRYDEFGLFLKDWFSKGLADLWISTTSYAQWSQYKRIREQTYRGIKKLLYEKAHR